MALPNLRLFRQPVESAPAAASAAAGPDLDQVFRLYAPQVAARGLAMLGSADEADDLVQEVFLRAFRAIGHLSDREAVRPWLLTIAVREGLRRLKKRRLSRLWFPTEDFDFERLAAPQASQEVKLQVGRLFRVLEQLPAELRVAWVLRYLECETTDAVATQCGWSLSTTKRRIAAAQEKVLKGMSA